MPLASDDGGSGEMTWTGNIEVPVGKQVILYYWYQTLNLDRNYIEINNNKITLNFLDTTNNAIQSIDITTEAGSAITQIKMVRGAGPNHATAIAGISVDGEILVDAGLGNNGFFLPFDPAQTGKDYTNTVNVTTDNGKFYATMSPERIFNGNIATGSDTATVNDPNQFIEVSGLGLTGSLDVEVVYSGAKLEADDVEVAADGLVKTARFNVTNLDKIKASGAFEYGKGQSASLYSITVNGSMLVDHSSIGVDMSGNDNHFHDENLSVPENYAYKELNDPSRVTFVGSWNGTPDNLFNGVLDYNNAFAMLSSDLNSHILIDVSGATLPGLINLRVWNAAEAANQTTEWQLEALASDDSVLASSLIQTWTQTSKWNEGSRPFYVDAPSNTAKLKLKCISNSASDKNWGIGQLDFTFGTLDTVFDTPMKSYAILEPILNNNGSANNGNLNGLGQSGKKRGFLGASGGGKTTGKYYFEVSPLSGSDDSLIQPEIGVVEVGGDNENWSASYADLGITTFEQVIGVAWDAGAGSLDFYVDGVSVSPAGFPDNPIDLGEPATPYFSVYGTEASVTAANFGQQPFVYTPPAGYEGLYQEWEEYARSVSQAAAERIAELEGQLAAQAPFVALMAALVRPWELGATYQYGDIVKFRGRAYQAEASDIKLLAPDQVTTADGVVAWRDLNVQLEAPKTFERPEEEQPAIMPISDVSSMDTGIS